MEKKRQRGGFSKREEKKKGGQVRTLSHFNKASPWHYDFKGVSSLFVNQERADTAVGVGRVWVGTGNGGLCSGCCGGGGVQVERGRYKCIGDGRPHGRRW